MPPRLDPSLTSTKASVFCLRSVRTHPLTTTGESVGSIASAALMRGYTCVVGVVVLEKSKEDDVALLLRIVIGGAEKADTERIPLLALRRTVATIAAMRQDRAMMDLKEEFLPGNNMRFFLCV